MKAEYFPPREDVILQNEAPTDMYILVTGSVVRNIITLHDTSIWYIRNIRIYIYMMSFFELWKSIQKCEHKDLLYLTISRMKFWNHHNK